MNKIKNLNKGILLSSFILFAFLFVQCSKSQQHEIPLQQPEHKVPKGKMVESASREFKEFDKAKQNKVRIRSRYVAFYAKDGSLPEKRTLTEKVYFDQKGLRTEQVRYTSLGDIDLRWLFEYDANGNIIKMTTKNGSGAVAAVRTSQYDKNNNEILRVINEANVKGEKRTEYKYDNENNLLEVKEYSNKGELEQTIEYQYEKGFLFKITNISSTGKIIAETFKEYNDAGYLIKEETKVNGASVIAYYKYDDKGNLIEALKDNLKRTYKYDAGNNVVEDKLVTDKGLVQFNVNFTYLDNGLQHEEIRMTATGQPAFNAEYKYELY